MQALVLLSHAACNDPMNNQLKPLTASFTLLLMCYATEKQNLLKKTASKDIFP